MYKQKRVRVNFTCKSCNNIVNTRKDYIKDKELNKCNICFIPEHYCDVSFCKNNQIICSKCKHLLT